MCANEKTLCAQFFTVKSPCEMNFEYMWKMVDANDEKYSIPNQWKFC